MIDTAGAPAAATARRGTTIAGEAFPRPDFYALDELLSDEERAVRDRVRDFVDREVVPIIGPCWERAEFPLELIPKMRDLGTIGGSIAGYGCPGLNAVTVGLVAAELSRGDTSVNVFFGVSGLAMSTIARCGSEEQRARWLPPLARLEMLGAFALTEPLVGSDAAHIQTTARRDGDAYVIDGAKRWIGNGLRADLIVVWARDDDGKVAAFLVEGGTPGLDAAPMGASSPPALSRTPTSPSPASASRPRTASPTAPISAIPPRS